MTRMGIVPMAIVIGLGLALARQQENKAQRADIRDVHQEKRITRGVKNGQLTPREARRLEVQQGRIKKTEAKAKAYGKVTPRERAKINREQDRPSRNIYRKKHNQKTQDR